MTLPRNPLPKPNLEPKAFAGGNAPEFHCIAMWQETRVPSNYFIKGSQPHSMNCAANNCRGLDNKPVEKEK